LVWVNTTRPYFDCVLFDLDGTLIDSSDLVVSSVKFAARQSGKRVPKKHDILERWNLNPSPRKLLRQFRVYDDSDYWEYYSKHVSKLRTIERGARGKLEAIKGVGLKVGLITSLPGEAVGGILARFGLSKFFDVVKTAQWRTPKWKLIDSAIKEAEISASDFPPPVIYIGDRESDVNAAKRANRCNGIWAGVVLRTGRRIQEFSEVEPDFVFRNLEDILTTVKRGSKPADDIFSPAKDCYTPNQPYLSERQKIARESCRNCFFPADCMNCVRFGHLMTLRPTKREFRSLSERVGTTVRSSEWYYPRIVHTTDRDMKDIRNVLTAFKGGNHSFKFRLGLSMAYTLERLGSAKEFRNIDLIVPVPSTKKKIAKRGYNPPEELARVLGEKIRIPVISKCLQTTAKRSRRQTRYEKDFDEDVERLVRNVHVKNRNLLAGKKILLVDDVLTDGATLKANITKIRQVVKPRPKVVALTFGLTKKAR
jgi:pyrophosphatase PpaX